MVQLNEIVDRYLKENGINTKFFSDYTGIEYTKCTRWLKGERKLKPAQLKKVYQFLDGNSIKTVNDILNGE